MGLYRILMTLMMDYDNPSNRCSYVFMESDTPRVILASIIPGRIINSGFEPCSPDKRWGTTEMWRKTEDDNLHQWVLRHGKSQSTSAVSGLHCKPLPFFSEWHPRRFLMRNGRNGYGSKYFLSFWCGWWPVHPPVSSQMALGFWG